MLLLPTLCLILHILPPAEAESQVLPAIVSNNETVSVNGSFPLGQCSSHVDIGLSLFCTEPDTNVLFDGVIPTLTGLDGDMWASQLLTLETQTVDNSAMVSLNFATEPTSAQVERVEIVMFNCQLWGISAQDILINSFPDGRSFPKSVDVKSCDSLVRVCTRVQTNAPQLITVGFIQEAKSSWVHLAEVTVYNDSSVCPPDAIVDDSIFPPPPATTTVNDALSTTEREACPSCTSDILTPAITAIVTALLATVVFVLVQIAVCRCCLKSAPGKGASVREDDQYVHMNGVASIQQSTNEAGTSAGGEQEYEQMERYEGGVAPSDGSYVEVGSSGDPNYMQIGPGDPNYVQIGPGDPQIGPGDTNYVEVGLAAGAGDQLEENGAYNGRNELGKMAGGNVFQVQENIAYAVSEKL